MAREGYRWWFGKCNDFNLHGVFSRDRLQGIYEMGCGPRAWLSAISSRLRGHESLRT